jgi:hypothetical protein
MGEEEKVMRWFKSDIASFNLNKLKKYLNILAHFDADRLVNDEIVTSKFHRNPTIKDT